MRIIKSLKFAKTFNELYDYIDDNTVETLDQYENDDYDVIDYDSLEQGEVPITDENVDRYLVETNLEEDEKREIIPTEEFPMEEVLIEEAPTVVEPVEPIKEVPTEEEKEKQEVPAAEESIPDPEDDAKKHFGSNIREALEWAKEKKRVVQIFYNTEGRRRGVGGKKYLKREFDLPKLDGGGVNINRIIEPHYFFHAKTTKRDILVTYDRSVRYIRAFVVNNITDYNFTKKRGTDEDQYFGRTSRPGIKMPIGTEPIKRIDKMENINDSLTNMEAALKVKGLVKSAFVVKNVEDVLKSIKTAQYVGVQGYWIRNRRCWDNCYRQKRTTQPETPAQEVWMQCWDEYREAINNPKSGWEKYAKRNKDVKISAKKEKQLNKTFASNVSKKVKKGMSTPEAVYTTIEGKTDAQKDKILESSSQLMELADTLKSSGHIDLGEKLANLSAEMLKEAGFGNLMKGLGKGFGKGVADVGRGIADMWKGTKKVDISEIGTRINEISQKAMELAEKIRQNIKYKVKTPTQTQTNASSSKKIIIEAKKIQKEAQFGQYVGPAQTQPKTQEQIAAEKAKADRARQLEEEATGEVGRQEAVAGEQAVADTAAEEIATQQPTAAPQGNQYASPDVKQTINDVNSIAYQADQLAAWLGANIPVGHPNRANAEAAIRSLQTSAKTVRDFTASGNLNNQETARKLEELAQGATSALSLVGGPPPAAGDTAVGGAGVGGAGAGVGGAGAGVGGAGVGGAGAGVGGAGVSGQGMITGNEQSDIQSLTSNPQAYNYIKDIMGKIDARSKQKTSQPTAKASVYNHKLKIAK